MSLCCSTQNRHEAPEHASLATHDSQAACVAPQGKYINDPEVLKEAARAAGVAGGERVVEDESIAADQVGVGAPHMHMIACTRQVTITGALGGPSSATPGHAADWCALSRSLQCWRKRSHHHMLIGLEAWLGPLVG